MTQSQPYIASIKTSYIDRSKLKTIHEDTQLDEQNFSTLSHYSYKRQNKVGEGLLKSKMAPFRNYKVTNESAMGSKP